MKMKTIVITSFALLGLGLVSVGGLYAFGKWKASQPSKENFDRVVRALRAPTIEEVKDLLQLSHGAGKKDAWPNPCLSLPGIEKLPVDKLRSSSNPPHYAVAIFLNKDRTSYDRVANKTIPYLNRLKQLGILTKHTKTAVPGEGRESGTMFDASVFELSPEYEHQNHPQKLACFSLGEPSLEIVDIQIVENDVNRLTDASFRYKLKLVFKNPPSWMHDSFLKGGWPDLRGALEHGMACQGEFGFDRKSREKTSGGGSCWWAFDSYDENY